MRATVGVLLALLAWSGRASAAEPEAVHLTVVGSSSCVSEATLRAELARLGAPYREAAPGASARVFTIAVEDGRVKKGRLLVRDLLGAEQTREVQRDDCASTARALALFVALALDEGASEHADEAPGSTPVEAAQEPIAESTTSSRGDMAPDVSFWPAPAEAPPLRPPPDRRVGGFALSGFYGGTWRGSITGLRVTTSLVKVGRTRFGASGALWDEDSKFRGITRSAQVGALVSWGAPWNDSVAGFKGELGVANGSGVDAFTSPYVGWSLVLQVPWKIPVRPIATLSATWLPLSDAASHSAWAIADFGVACQAW